MGPKDLLTPKLALPKLVKHTRGETQETDKNHIKAASKKIMNSCQDEDYIEAEMKKLIQHHLRVFEFQQQTQQQQKQQQLPQQPPPQQLEHGYTNTGCPFDFNHSTQENESDLVVHMQPPARFLRRTRKVSRAKQIG